jgi:hypothetical protein
MSKSNPSSEEVAGPLGPWQLTIDFPESLHSLGVHLPAEERYEHLRGVAKAVWPGGTEFQRDTVLSWYSDVANDAVSGGAFYSGFWLASTDDDRITTASLLGRVDQLKEQDAQASASGLRELLSQNPATDVEPVDVPCGPAVLTITGMEWTPPSPEGNTSGNGNPAEVPMARVDLYVPVPVMSRLLVLSLTTPSVQELPEYVGLLSYIAQSISVRAVSAGAPADAPHAVESGQTKVSIADKVQQDFG